MSLPRSLAAPIAPAWRKDEAAWAAALALWSPRGLTSGGYWPLVAHGAWTQSGLCGRRACGRKTVCFGTSCQNCSGQGPRVVRYVTVYGCSLLSATALPAAAQSSTRQSALRMRSGSGKGLPVAALFSLSARLVCPRSVPTEALPRTRCLALIMTGKTFSERACTDRSSASGVRSQKYHFSSSSRSQSGQCWTEALS